MFGLFNRAPALDEESAAWLFDVYAWALRHFGSDVFRDETRLVLPTDEFFPGRADSVHALAELMFRRVQTYAGLAHWPTELVPPMGFDPNAPARVQIEGPLRGAGGIVPKEVAPGGRLRLSYDPQLVNNPEALIASFAQNFAHYLASLAPEEPPGGRENWAPMTEVLTVFLGFGVMAANTALEVRTGGCGACAQPASRTSYLSQYDITYALGIFTVLKGESEKNAARHLKSALRPFYKRAVREIGGRVEAVGALQAIERPLLVGSGR